MTHKILCAVDGTAHSERAVEFAAELSAKLGAELSICSVNVLLIGSRLGPSYVHAEEEMERIVASAAGIAEGKGVKVAHRAVLTSREVAAGVVAHAEANHCDIIVTGTGDKRGLSRLMLGSVAQDIATRAHCTVIIAR